MNDIYIIQRIITLMALLLFVYIVPLWSGTTVLPNCANHIIVAYAVLASIIHKELKRNTQYVQFEGANSRCSFYGKFVIFLKFSF